MDGSDEIRIANAESVQSVTSLVVPILGVYWSPFVASSFYPGFAGRSSQKSEKFIRRFAQILNNQLIESIFVDRDEGKRGTITDDADIADWGAVAAATMFQRPR